MKRKVNFVLLVALGATMVTVTAAAQNSTPINARETPRIEYAIYVPAQNAALFRQVDWDDHHRCDGDHDRDDRHCYWRGRDRDQYYYRGNGYVGNAPVYPQGGWYDNRGGWHGDGWYDRHGKWHKGKPHRDGEDR